METIEPQLLRRRRLGGAADKHRKVLDAADVVLLRLLSKMTGSHIVDHALTKRADRHTQLLLRMRLTPHSQSELSARLDGSEGKLRATQQPTARAVSFNGLNGSLKTVCSETRCAVSPASKPCLELHPASRQPS